MKMTQVRQVAKGKNIKTAKMKKADIIRAVQREEKTFECFATQRLMGCNEHTCLWREDCISENRKNGVTA